MSFFLVFFSLKGVKPVLRLTTADGAIFENSDPLNLTFGETAPLASTVLDWIMPPLSQRYLEACATSKVGEQRLTRIWLETRIQFQNLIIESLQFRCRSMHPIAFGSRRFNAVANNQRSNYYSKIESAAIQVAAFSKKSIDHRFDAVFSRRRRHEILSASSAHHQPIDDIKS